METVVFTARTSSRAVAASVVAKTLVPEVSVSLLAVLYVTASGASAPTPGCRDDRRLDQLAVTSPVRGQRPEKRIPPYSRRFGM